ncbi:hypothetical protein SAMN05216199_1258 [Pedococcus cremeus]|uniref:Uncharacterized protein n=1 Tax=Pedococcus cremeus TaxID=587636 RepID=A0A1H9S4P8_9MICO|nr:hypothetical protein SAMN05216199_1258 [Pedococcus cremeus]
MDRLTEPRTPVKCAETRCAAVLYVEPQHADNLRGTWRCLDHKDMTA